MSESERDQLRAEHGRFKAALQRIERDDEYGSDEAARIWMKAVAEGALRPEHSPFNREASQ